MPPVHCNPWRFLGVLWVVCVAAAASAQSLPDHGGSRDMPAGGVVVDVNNVDPDTFRAVATRLEPREAVTIDGRLNDEAWRRAGRYGRFIQR